MKTARGILNGVTLGFVLWFIIILGVLALPGCAHGPGLPEHQLLHSPEYPCPGGTINVCTQGGSTMWCVCEPPGF